MNKSPRMGGLIDHVSTTLLCPSGCRFRVEFNLFMPVPLTQGPPTRGALVGGSTRL